MAGNAVVRVGEPMPVDESWPQASREILQACSIALRLLRAGKLHALDEFGGTLPDHVRCSAQALELVNSIPQTAFVRHGVGGKKGCTVAVCSKCGRWSVVTGGTPPTAKVLANGGPKPIKCLATRNCGGTMTKAYAAAVLS